MVKNEKTNSTLLKKLESIENRLEKLMNSQAVSSWLDNKEVCKILRVSIRTLQTYRDEGILPFSQFRDKILYKSADIHEHLEKNYKKAFSKKI